MIAVLVLLLLHFVAHFIPFERAALSLDDLARLNSSQWSLAFFVKEMLGSLDYPLVIFHNLIVLTAGEEPFLRVFFVFLSSGLVTVLVYLLLRELLGEGPVPFLGALFYNLIPNKLTLYHTLEYTYIHLSLWLYLLSFLFFIRFTKSEQRRFLWGSLACYGVGLFWYLLGFFLPAVLGAYALLVHRRKAKFLWLFLVPLVAYLAWRFNLLGQATSAEAKPYDLQLHRTAANLFRAVPHLYLGRQMAKAVLYGLYRFFSIPLPWGPLVAGADLALLYGLWRWLQARALPAVPGRILWLGVVLFFMLLAPALLTWGVMDRHTALSSIGAVLVLLWGISRLRHLQRVAVLGLAAVGLMVSQGTAWSQVVACRMNQAIAETLRDRKAEILAAQRVLIDQYSFSREIPYTWVRDPHNQLDTYWGVQALLGRGNPFLVHWAVGKKKEVEVIRSPLQVSGDAIRFQVYNPDTYQLEETSIPREGSVLIDYAAVYPNGFRSDHRAGLRQ